MTKPFKSKVVEYKMDRDIQRIYSDPFYSGSDEPLIFAGQPHVILKVRLWLTKWQIKQYLKDTSWVQLHTNGRMRSS